MITISQGVINTPTTVNTMPRITPTIRADRTDALRSCLSFAPYALDIRIVAPEEIPFIKFKGNLKRVATELMAASPIFPAN